MRMAVDYEGAIRRFTTAWTLTDFTRDHLAGCKLPRQVLFVEAVRRAPNGKAEYKWAREQAERLAETT